MQSDVAMNFYFFSLPISKPLKDGHFYMFGVNHYIHERLIDLKHLLSVNMFVKNKIHILYILLRERKSIRVTL